jgi:hypothetical protein
MRSRLARSSLALAVAAGLWGCAPPPAPPVQPRPVAPVLAVASPVPAPAPAEAAPAPAPEEPVTPLPPWIARLDDTACAWTTSRWGRRVVTDLRLRPGGPVFARVTGGRAQLQIPVGRRDHGLVDIGSGGLVLTGFVDRSQVTLYAAEGFAVNGVLFPVSSYPLVWKEGFSDGVSVTMDVPNAVIVNRPPLTARRPCTDLSLDRGTPVNLPRAALGQDHGSAAIIRGGRAIEVFSDPSRPAEIKLLVPQEMFAQVYARQGLFSRIGVHRAEVFIAGWVRSANLRETKGSGLGHLLGSRSSGVGSYRRKALRRLVCSSDVPVIAEAGEEKMTVGYIMSGTAFDVLGENGPFSGVQVKDRNIHTTLLSRASDLKACKKLENVD